LRLKDAGWTEAKGLMKSAPFGTWEAVTVSELALPDFARFQLGRTSR
jgi:hypothetical protein